MTSREKFEAWALTDDGNCDHKDLQRGIRDDEYVNGLVERDWLVWQAARAQMAEEAAKICDRMVSVSAISYETGSACACAIRALATEKS